MYTDQDITNLVTRVAVLERELENQPAARQSLPDLGILSRNFLTRSFSVWGLYFVANLLIGIVFGCIFVVIGLLLGASFTEMLNQILKGVPLT
ncbi:MAG TPA: hypothetical protein PKK59_07310 [Anaerolineaceae bacterium]|nr:hypothetical protein [Anaerolineaceae bacterium]